MLRSTAANSQSPISATLYQELPAAHSSQVSLTFTPVAYLGGKVSISNKCCSFKLCFFIFYLKNPEEMHHGFYKIHSAQCFQL